MKILRFLTTLFALALPAVAQQVDYRALGTNAFYTNSLIVNSKHWTNQTGQYLYPAGHSSVNPSGAAGPGFFFRPDGSLFVGTNITVDTPPTASGIRIPYVVSMTDSNEPNNIFAGWWATDSILYNTYSTANFVIQQGGLALFSFLGQATPTSYRALNFAVGPGFSPISYYSNAIAPFEILEDGRPKITFAAGVDKVLGSDATGVGTWTNIAALVTNNQARIGPGTNNFIAKFNVVGGTNVGNSPLYSELTNSVAQRQSAVTGATYTNPATNLIFSIETANANTNGRLELVAGNPYASEASHVRFSTLFPNARTPLYLNDGVGVEPGNNPLGGHGAGYIYPLTDAVSDNGTTGLRWRDVNASRVFTAPGRDDSIIFGTGYTGNGFGVGSSGNLYFTAYGFGFQANKDRQFGRPTLDMSGWYIGAGVSSSNTVAFLGGDGQIYAQLGSAMNNIFQVGTNNTGAAAPIAAGFIAGPSTGTDKGGSDLKLIGGPSTGTGTNGNVRIQTSEKANSTSSSINATQKDRIFVIADPIILTTNSATIVANITIPTALRGVGGTVIAHTEIENGVDIATTDETFTISANRKGSTVVAGSPSTVISSTSTSGGSASIANTWTLVANAQSVDLKLTCVTGGINSTNSTVRVTIIPNSSAVPVITHP